MEKNWLRIGWSEKVEKKTSSKYSRRKTGEKGIGRLSADRLGSVLELRSKKNRHAASGLLIDWSKFEKPGVDASNIELAEIPDPKPTVPVKRLNSGAITGTELSISRLRQKWTGDDIEKLYKELSILLPPYPELSKNFSINFTNDVDVQFNGKIQYSSRTEGEIEFSAKLAIDGSLAYQLKFYDPKDRKKRKITQRTIQWVGLAPDPDPGNQVEPYTLGQVDIRLSYFVQRSDLLENTGLKLGELREFLARNAGVRIYRDTVRVKPYGDPGGESDWLGLGERKLKDPAGARRRTFKIAPNQLVGAIFVGRDNTPSLVDSSAREGLIENDAFKQLRVVLMRCVNLIESKYHEITVQNVRADNHASRAKAAVRSLAGNLSSLTGELTHLQQRISEDLSEDVAAVQEQIQLFIQQAESAGKDIEEIANQNTVFRGLATVGIASAIFGHETSLAVAQAAGKVIVARAFLQKNPPNVIRAVERIDQAHVYMDRVSAWGKFALGRVNKDKRQRKKVSVSGLVSTILNELEGPMGKSHVALNRFIEPNIEAKTFPMDVEVVLINYLTNAYHEVKRYSRERIINVSLTESMSDGKNGFQLSVADSGNGIPPEHKKMIWEPLFSTKTDERGRAAGTGLGLSIVKSAVEELAGEVDVRFDGPLSGATFIAWFPKGN